MWIYVDGKENVVYLLHTWFAISWGSGRLPKVNYSCFLEEIEILGGSHIISCWDQAGRLKAIKHNPLKLMIVEGSDLFSSKNITEVGRSKTSRMSTMKSGNRCMTWKPNGKPCIAFYVGILSPILLSSHTFVVIIFHKHLSWEDRYLLLEVAAEWRAEQSKKRSHFLVSCGSWVHC